jgi:hypothetical protein
MHSNYPDVCSLPEFFIVAAKIINRAGLAEMGCIFNRAAMLHGRCEIPNVGPGLAISPVCPRRRAQWHQDRLRRHSTPHRNLGNETDPLGRRQPKTDLHAWVCTFRALVRPATSGFLCCIKCILPFCRTGHCSLLNTQSRQILNICPASDQSKLLSLTLASFDVSDRHRW